MKHVIEMDEHGTLRYGGIRLTKKMGGWYGSIKMPGKRLAHLQFLGNTPEEAAREIDLILYGQESGD